VVCQANAPIVHGLEAQYGDKIHFIYLDIDDPKNDEFKKALNYYYRPTIYLLDKDGKVLQQWLGPVTKDQLEPALKDAMKG
jgi:hypothetical protein